MRAVVITLACLAASGQADTDLAQSVAQLRHAIGTWSVTTEFLNEDGSIARAVRGTYGFHWVVPDRVVRGESVIPALDQRSALLFYVAEPRRVIEMVSVGGDGQLFVMTGPLGGETRETPDVVIGNGPPLRLRFTRYNVTPDRFESRMERSVDGGKSWVPGNHQVFVRTAG